jgi:hypothetical protein
VTGALCRLTLAEAKSAKWRAGRDAYGPDWHGEHPLVEAFSEAVDLLNYLDEAARRGEEVEKIVEAAELLARVLQGRSRALTEAA